MTQLSIAILNWNGKKLLQEYLPSVVEYSKGHQIYVIDNCSTDHSIHFLESNFPTVKIIPLKKNYGFAKGYNLGLQKIDTEIVCLLNNDVRVTRNWLEPVLNLFKEKPEISVLQPKILSDKEMDRFEYAGAAGGYIDNLGYPYCRGRLFNQMEKDIGQYNNIQEIFWASGACLFIRKSCFDEVGGFDEDFFAHQEEIDLCWRLKNRKKQIWYCGISTVYHLGGGTLNKQSSQKTYLNIRNSLLMLLKNLPTHQLFYRIFLRLVFDGISSFYFAYSGGCKHLLATLKAHFAFYGMMKKTYKKREKNQENFLLVKFIPIQYFVMGRKGLNQLK